MTTTDPIVRLAQAMDFAARQHADQRRKGTRGEPYINHPAEVARLLAEATGGADPDLVIAGLLHDTVEDTDAEPADLRARFGEDVAGLVSEVTDDKTLPKAERKRRQVESAPGKSPRAKRLKIADKTSNLRSLASSPPGDWAPARLNAYVDWAESVVAGCRGVDPGLERHFDAALARIRRA